MTWWHANRLNLPLAAPVSLPTSGKGLWLGLLLLLKACLQHFAADAALFPEACRTSTVAKTKASTVQNTLAMLFQNSSKAEIFAAPLEQCCNSHVTSSGFLTRWSHKQTRTTPEPYQGNAEQFPLHARGSARAHSWSLAALPQRGPQLFLHRS